MIPRRAFFLHAAAVLALVGWDRDAFARSAIRRPKGLPHPEPRLGITGDSVLPESELGERRRVLKAYAAARTHPELFDGVYCACECDKSMGHRSLLSCFESAMPQSCGICLGEARLARRLHGRGQSLDEIRAAVDRSYGGRRDGDHAHGGG